MEIRRGLSDRKVNLDKKKRREGFDRDHRVKGRNTASEAFTSHESGSPHSPWAFA